MKMDKNRQDFVEQLYCDYADKLFLFALRKVKNEDCAEDLLQDVFMIACENSRKLMEHPNRPVWLYKTMNFLILQIQCDLYKENIPLEECKNIASGSPLISLEIMLPSEISETERKIFLMRFEQQLPYSDIAQQLHMTAVNCRTIVSRIIGRCRAGKVD